MTAPEPDCIGPYRLLERLGEGGMGTVYLAEQRQPVHRRVALKVVKAGMDSVAVLRRFDAERQALSMMEHSAVARIFDAGITEQGRPYFAMEYVKGIPITDYCDQHMLPLPSRIALFQQVCSGVQHAHLKGVMHRDLKPGNVLVTVQDGRPMPKIIDFGLAKAMDHRLVAGTLHTEHGQILGTPEYMSPEQAGIAGLDVDTRTDVYSLGVLLYELLTGQLPFTRQQLIQGGHPELQRVLRETDPPKPSTRLSAAGAAAAELARRRATELAELQRRLRGDLDWIVMRAIEKDRTRRYETPLELAADLGRYLQSQPVLARPPGAFYRLRKFVRRNRAQVVAGSVAVLALCSGAAGLVLGLVRARDEAERAAIEGARAAAEAAARQQMVRDFARIAGIVRLRDAQRREEELHPPWPERRQDLEQWLQQDHAAVTGLRAQVQEDLRALQSLPARTRDEDFVLEQLQQLELGIADLDRRRQSVAERLHWAERIEPATLRHPRAAFSWDEARTFVRESRAYRSVPFDLAPQLGLVPIGANPQTGLLEFYDLRSAREGGATVDPSSLAIPRHAADGSLPDTAAGVVFVLVPGGRLQMGSQPGRDRMSRDSERPAHEVALEPFLISRFELTQRQWLALGGDDNPSTFRPDNTAIGVPFTPDHPVETVSWFDCERLLRRAGMTLPTEAQWEWACRAGVDLPWWCGQEPRSLQGVANLLDRAAKVRGGYAGEAVPFEDGFLLTAPVRASLLAANPFGLHQVHGNVWEWCQDPALPYTAPTRAGDGLRLGASPHRVLRGGSWIDGAERARSTARSDLPPDEKHNHIGLRPARLLLR